MKYEILDDSGNVLNTIVAEQDFMDMKYPGHYRPAPPDPVIIIPAVPIITKVAFISRFTPQEYVGVINATKTDVEVQAWYDLFQAANVVDLSDQRTISGMDSFVAKGLLTQARATEILTAPVQPNERP